MNTTLAELKLDQDQDQTAQDQLEDHLPPPSLLPPHPPQPSDTSALWEAIERLDDMVVNNTVKVKTHLSLLDGTPSCLQSHDQRPADVLV